MIQNIYPATSGRTKMVGQETTHTSEEQLWREINGRIKGNIEVSSSGHKGAINFNSLSSRVTHPPLYTCNDRSLREIVSTTRDSPSCAFAIRSKYPSD